MKALCFDRPCFMRLRRLWPRKKWQPRKESGTHAISGKWQFWQVKAENITWFHDGIPPSIFSKQFFFFFPFYSSGLWSPIDTACSPNFHSANSFSAFGSSNSFNLTGGSNPCGTRVLKTKECWRTFILDKHAFLHTHCFCVCFVVFSAPKSPEPQQSWSDITSVSSSIWDVPSSDSLHSWPSSSSSPTAPTAVRAWICLSCQYFLVCEHAAFIELLFFFFSPSHSWETPAIPGLQPAHSGAPSGQRVQIQP